jgi:hypothetical protein
MTKLSKMLQTGLIATMSLNTTNCTDTVKADTQPVGTNLTTHLQVSQKREAQKVYHRFEDIPEISDKDAALYNRDEYTYIINADKYQKSGEMELKRVLKNEVTSANMLSLVYCSECASYIPKKNEDQLAIYHVDPTIVSSNGLYKGPSQMDDHTVESFFKFLATNSKSSPYAFPFLKSKTGSLKDAAQQLASRYYDSEGDLLPMDKRNAAIHSTEFKNLILNRKAWVKLASQKLKRRNARGNLSDITMNYLCLAETYPNQEDFLRHLEDYNLGFYSIGRAGKPKDVTHALAGKLKLHNKSGDVDATRLPAYVIMASVSHINWRGNGNIALNKAKEFKSGGSQDKTLKTMASSWVTGKSRTSGVDTMSQLNMITETHVRQYTELDLSGARELEHRYKAAVQQAEKKVHRKSLLSLLAFHSKYFQSK